MDWLEVVARFIFFWIDKVIYGFIPTIYNLLIEIAETTVFSEDVISLFASKIYALLGIVMLFKVSFSILTYIVDPDAFLDKSKGFGKLISSVIITLVLLVLTPWIFTQAIDLQTIILRDNIIGNIFSVDGADSYSNGDAGNKMAYETFKAFYHIDTILFPECTSGESSALSDPEGCKGSIKLKGDDNDTDWTNLQDTLNYAYNTNSVSIYMNFDLLNLKSESDEYVFNYMPIVSTICGVVILLLLVIFCFDVAVRSIKLGFLNMIAPVPIISRIDPKKGKETFDKWVKTCVSTYLDLFIRLLAIYFAVFVISQVIDLQFVSLTTGSTKSVDAFVKIFIILGALMFAKQFPKLLEDILGFKMDGKFTLNPMSKLRQTPLVGAGVTTAAALAGGAYAGLKAGQQANTPLRGMWQGMMGANREIKGKVSWLGDDKGGKSPKAFYTGMQAGHKSITGRDYEVFDPWKMIGHTKGKDKVDELKDSKYTLQGEQAKLDADLQSLYDKLKHTPESDTKTRNNLTVDIEKNRSEYGKLAKHISVIDDQIKDVKRLYRIDESPKNDLNDALAKANEIRKNKNSNYNGNNGI